MLRARLFGGLRVEVDGRDVPPAPGLRPRSLLAFLLLHPGPHPRARLAGRFPQLVAKDADFAVKVILDAMTAALARGDRIEIRGFGSFSLNHRPPRVGRNPKSGERVEVPAKHVPHFKAGKELRERVDGQD